MGTSSNFDAHRDSNHACASKSLWSTHSLCALTSHDENLMHKAGKKYNKDLFDPEVIAFFSSQ